MVSPHTGVEIQEKAFVLQAPISRSSELQKSAKGRREKKYVSKNAPLFHNTLWLCYNSNTQKFYITLYLHPPSSAQRNCWISPSIAAFSIFHPLSHTAQTPTHFQSVFHPQKPPHPKYLPMALLNAVSSFLILTHLLSHFSPIECVCLCM